MSCYVWKLLKYPLLFLYMLVCVCEREQKPVSIMAGCMQWPDRWGQNVPGGRLHGSTPQPGNLTKAWLQLCDIHLWDCEISCNSGLNDVWLRQDAFSCIWLLNDESLRQSVFSHLWMLNDEPLRQDVFIHLWLLIDEPLCSLKNWSLSGCIESKLLFKQPVA